MFFGLDVETLGVESTSVILSVGLCYVEDNSPRSYQDILDKSIFVKLNAKEQIEKYNRVVDQSTLEWWNKQSDYAKDRNYKPKKTDFGVVEGLTIINKWVDSIGTKDSLCWIRGSLDQMCLDSLCKAADVNLPFKYNAYRDVRTALDLIYPDSKNGYVDVDPELCIGFDRGLVLKHSPEHDCSFDMAMMLYGKR